MKNIFKLNQSGVALLITMLLLGTILATALGITALIINETAVNRLVDDSVLAVFSADAGLEKMLYACSSKITYPSPASFTNADIGDGASYEVHMDDDGIAPYTNSCNDGKIISIGEYVPAKRTFQANY